MEKGKFVIGSMPIGNKEDFTLRLIRWLKSCDLLVIESIKDTIHVLENSNIEYTKNYIEFNDIPESSSGPNKPGRLLATETILSYLKLGKVVLFICDEGTPGINDPGIDIFNIINLNGYDVEILPGPNVVTTAFTHAVSLDNNFNGYGFTFLQPHTDMDILKNTLENLKNVNTAIILTIEPEAFINLNTEKVLLDSLGNRPIAICENMTMYGEKTIKSDIKNLNSFLMRECYRTIVIYPG
jgi:16S rRNA (cytidine1402-2'-O)-methyltransferase